jgi:glucokinase
MDESGPSMLAGDVGGTKTDLAILVRRGGRLSATRQAEYASREHTSLEELIRRFLASDSGPRPEAACLAIAGPVEGGGVGTTNLPWRVEAAALGRAIGISRVELVNDLQAAAYGMLFLEGADFQVLHAVAHHREGTMAIIAPGTGLGEAILYWDGARHRPAASEGGHADFAPRDDQQIAMLRHLLAPVRRAREL